MTVDVDTRRASAQLAPSTFNRTARTVDAVLSSGAGVERRDARGTFTERLATGPGSYELHSARLPILDSHRQQSVADVLGFVSAVRSEAGNVVATLTITSDSALALIESGAVTGVSIGYRATDWAETEGGRVRTATKWTLLEVSLVPVPADPGATLRSQPMPDPTPNPAPNLAPNPAPAVMNRAQTNSAIRSLGATLGLGQPWVDAQLDGAVELDAARAAALVEIERRSAAGTIRVHQVGVSNDDPAVVQTRQAEALAHRMLPSIALPEPARQYAGLGYADHARLALQARGEPGLTFMPREMLLTRAVATGDLPNLLTSSGNRVLAAAYAAAPNPLKLLARQATAADFRKRSVLRLGEMAQLERVAENGEITHGGVVEAAEGYALATYAKMFSITRQALVNDDLSAFAGITGAMGRAAAETEANLLVALLIQSSGTGPLMSDGVRLFNAAHGNLAGSGGAISTTTLSAARLAMRQQKGVDGETPINAQAKYLLVSATKETEAETVLATIAPATVADVNVFSNRLTLLVEPRLAGNPWYTFADPAVLPVLEYAYLSSAPGPQMESRPGWDVLGMEFRVYEDFGCGAIDWRATFRNPGA